MFLVHITNPKSFVFNFWGSLHYGSGSLFGVWRTGNSGKILKDLKVLKVRKVLKDRKNRKT